jgi:hypothetical protein
MKLSSQLMPTDGRPAMNESVIAKSDATISGRRTTRDG